MPTELDNVCLLEFGIADIPGNFIVQRGSLRTDSNVKQPTGTLEHTCFTNVLTVLALSSLGSPKTWTALKAFNACLLTALIYYRSALYRFRQAQDWLNTARMLNRLGELYGLMGQDQATQLFCQTAVQTFDQIENITESSSALRNVAMCHYYKNRPQLALKLLKQSLNNSEQSGNSLEIAITLTCMAQVYEHQHQYLFALASDQAALETFQTIDHLDQVTNSAYRIALTLCHIGSLYKKTQHPEMAIQSYLEALESFETLNCTEDIAWVFNQLGQLHERQGRIILVLEYYQNSKYALQQRLPRLG